MHELVSDKPYRYGALRLVSVEQGYDPRDFSLVAFGGAGPLHANALGKLLHAFPIIIPPSPGVLCAFGDATTLLRHEVGRTFIRALSQTDKMDVLDEYEALLKQAKDIMREEQGVPESKQVCLFHLRRMSDLGKSNFQTAEEGWADLYVTRYSSSKPTFDTAAKQSMFP